jgi:DNA-directed RNA polymerase subunit RPC12/RpoP
MDMLLDLCEEGLSYFDEETSEYVEPTKDKLRETQVHFAKITLKEAGYDIIAKSLDEVIEAEGGRLAHHMDEVYLPGKPTIKYCPNCGATVVESNEGKGPQQQDGMEWYCDSCDTTFEVIVWPDTFEEDKDGHLRTPKEYNNKCEKCGGDLDDDTYVIEDDNGDDLIVCKKCFDEADEDDEDDNEDTKLLCPDCNNAIMTASWDKVYNRADIKCPSCGVIIYAFGAVDDEGVKEAIYLVKSGSYDECEGWGTDKKSYDVTL